jgi:hypothetical protein
VDFLRHTEMRGDAKSCGQSVRATSKVIMAKGLVLSALTHPNLDFHDISGSRRSVWLIGKTVKGLRDQIRG